MTERDLHLDGVRRWTWTSNEEKGITILLEKEDGDMERRHYYSLSNKYEVTGRFSKNSTDRYIVEMRNLINTLLKNPIH